MATTPEHLIRIQWKRDAEKKLEKAVDEYERGEFTPWQKGDCEKRGREYLKAKKVQEARMCCHHQ